MGVDRHAGGVGRPVRQLLGLVEEKQSWFRKKLSAIINTV